MSLQRTFRPHKLADVSAADELVHISGSLSFPRQAEDGQHGRHPAAPHDAAGESVAIAKWRRQLRPINNLSQNDDENADLLPKKRFDAHVNSTLQCNQQRWRRRAGAGGRERRCARERAGATGRRRARLPFLLREPWCRGWFWLHTHTCADDSVGPLPSQATWAPFQIEVEDCTTYGRSLHRGSRPPLSPPSLSGVGNGTRLRTNICPPRAI